MCNFHESVAVSAATDPSTGKVHAGHRAVIRVALSRYWASSYVEGAENVDGYNFYPLATADQQAAFERSGLKRPLDEVQTEEEGAIEFLRARISKIAEYLDLSPKALALPVATAREPFMDYAIDRIYEGDPKAGLAIVQTVAGDLRPLHAAVSALHADPQTSQMLERLVQGKICTLYTQAPEKVNRALVETYESLPERVKAASASLAKYGGNILLGGFSGIIGHGIHYASVLGAGMASGIASNANIALSGAFLLASYGGWHRIFGGQYQGARQQLNAFAVQAGLTMAIAFGAQSFLEHDHMNSEKAQWYASLDPETREMMLSGPTQTYNALPTDLRTKLEEAAREEGIPPSVYILICSGDDPLATEINAFMASGKGGAPSLGAP